MVDYHHLESVPSNLSETRTEVDSTMLADANDHISGGSDSAGKMNLDTSIDTSKESSSIISSDQSNQENFSTEQFPPEHCDLMLQILKNETPGCTCKKSKCLKLYCQCFAASALCDKEKCKCETCKNDITRGTEIKRARSNVLYRNPKAFEGKFTNTALARKLPCIRRNFSAMRNSVGRYPNQPLPHEATFSLPGPQSGPSISSLRNQGVVNHHPKVDFDLFSRNFSQMPYERVQVPVGPVGNSNGMERISNNDEVSISHKAGCKCRKSFCVKKYCECFQNGVKCGSNCRCVDCRNQPQGQPGMISNMNLPVKMNGRDFMAPSSLLVGMTVPTSHSKDMHMKSRAGCYVPFQSQQVRHMPGGIFPTQSINPIYLVQENRHRANFDHFDSIANVRRMDNNDDMRRTKMVLAAASATDMGGSRSVPNSHQNFDGPSSSKDVSSSQDKLALMAALAMTELAGSLNKKRTFQESNDVDDTVIAKKARSNHAAITNVDTTIELATVSKSSSSSSNVPSPSNSISTFHSSSSEENHAPQSNTTFPIQMAVTHVLEKKAKMMLDDSKEDTSTLSNTKLPRSLSYRKICSKCGRSRNEHGEFGFGNNCVFEDCAKCGASQRDHDQEGVPMGFHCSLTERGSPFVNAGMADCYLRKIYDMAAMAKLKKDFIANQHNQQHCETDKAMSVNVDAAQ